VTLVLLAEPVLWAPRVTRVILAHKEIRAPSVPLALRVSVV